MLILNLIEHETIWGGQKLVHNKHEKKKIGHLYSLITEEEMASKIINGAHAGETFRDYFSKNKSQLGMSEYRTFPFVVAIVDASDNLSIQVHPDDNAALTLENQRYGKNESWYFIEAPTDGWIYNGCVCRDINELHQKLQTRELDGLTDSLSVKPEDYIYIEAGTLHSLTSGSLVYEIEENCNLTYRFYDFDRKDEQGNPRELHLDKASEAVNINKRSSTKRYSNSEPIAERRYSTQLLKNISEYENNGQNLACLTLIDGGFELDGVDMLPGMSVLLLPGERITCDIKVAIVARPINT